MEWLVTFGRAHRLAWDRLRGEFLAGDHVDADITRTTDQVVHHRATSELEPPTARRFPDDDLGDVVGLRETDDVVGNMASDGRNGECLAAKRYRQAQGIGNPV